MNVGKPLSRLANLVGFGKRRQRSVPPAPRPLGPLRLRVVPVGHRRSPQQFRRDRARAMAGRKANVARMRAGR